MSASDSEAWRGFDRVRLDREYDARGTVDDIWPILARYRRLTDEAKAALPCETGVPYGPSEPERLDIYRVPGADRPVPVFVFVHGGYWRLLDAADSGFMAPLITAEGVMVVTVNYALLPNVELAETVRQCRAALAWVHANIARYGGDPARIHVGGNSAGGHLSAMLAADGWQDGSGLPRDAVRSATLISGLYDLEPLRHCHVNEWARLTAESAAANSPLRRLPRPDLPVLLSYAPSDTGEFKRQTALYRAALECQGNPTGFVEVPGRNHFDIILGMTCRDDPLTRGILRLIRGSG